MSMDPNQQPYGQPQPQYGQQPVYAGPAAPAPGKWGPTSVGIEAHIAAGIGYIVPIVGLIFALIEKNNRFVKFHGWQAFILGFGYLAVVIVQIIIGVIGGVLDTATNGTGIFSLISFLLSCLVGVLYFAVFALLIWGAIASFTGRNVKFPIVGNLAERLAGGPAVPAV
ncbi:MAG: hypothetical protein ABI068_00950 [Ktedonobacterales bacterium]